jgi:hypothetical protein
MMTLQDFLGRVSSLRFVEGSKFQRQRRSRNGAFVIVLSVCLIGTLASRHPRDASNGIKADKMTPVELPPAAD